MTNTCGQYHNKVCLTSRKRYSTSPRCCYLHCSEVWPPPGPPSLPPAYASFSSAGASDQQMRVRMEGCQPCMFRTRSVRSNKRKEATRKGCSEPSPLSPASASAFFSAPGPQIWSAQCHPPLPCCPSLPVHGQPASVGKNRRHIFRETQSSKSREHSRRKGSCHRLNLLRTAA